VISARSVAEAGLVWTGISRLAGRGRRGHALVLAYHNIIPDDVSDAGDRSLHLRHSVFARQLDLLADLCDVVPLPSVLIEPPVDARPRIAITFDDAYHGALTLGASELRARRMPATVFVPPGLLGTDAFWWDAVAGPEGLSAARREHAMVELRGDGDAVRAWAAADGGRVHSVPHWLRPGVEAEVREWVQDEAMTVGAHTWRHPNLSRLSPEDAADELVRSRRWLSEHIPRGIVPWLTYPYGLATPAVTAAAAAAGYDAALAATGGWIGRPAGDRYWLPRMNVPSGLSLYGFRLRLAGMLGSVVAPTQHIHNLYDVTAS
jgi:peptidoglycan/xylan/chitin deacetylase (PgdA/CDA1 family)